MRNHLGTLFIALAIVFGLLIAASAYKYKFRSAETITVTGLAQKDFTSDQVSWSANFSRSSMDIKSAFAALKQDEILIKQYLNNKGVAESNFLFSAINIQKKTENKFNDKGNVVASVFTGYVLTESVELQSKKLDLIEKISRESTELIEKGIEFNSTSPQYYYSKLNELKVDLLAKASQDARTRAETIANNSKSGLGNIRKASMGVFQITGKNENEDFSSGAHLIQLRKIRKPL